MKNYNVTIGLVPLRRDCTPRPGIFNWEFAEERGRKTVAYIEEHFTTEHVTFVDLKGVIDVETLWSTSDVEKVAAHFKANGVDAIVLIAANFGNEEAAGELAKAMGLPTLLWGPQDDTFYEDGGRHTDTQCGLFGISRMLQRMNVKFTYVENCPVDSDIFAEGFVSFTRVAAAVKAMTGLRIGEVGLRPKPFCSVIINEGQLMEEFDTHVIPINLAVIRDKFEKILAERQDELTEGAAKLREMYEIDADTEANLEKMWAFVIMYQELFDEYKLDAISAECWTAMQQLVGAMPCTSYGVLADMGYIISCESDLHAAMTQVLLKALTFGESVPFLGEFTTRHPSDRNAELLWHCGPFAHSLHRKDEPCYSKNMREWFQVKPGHFTVARIDQDHGHYSIVAGECDSTTGPYTFGTYLWAKFKNLPAWERKLVEGPYIHHVSEIEGGWTEEIREACKYIPALHFDGVEE
ncbi:MAG: hypothetical protein IJF67_17455 [Clostridia bacterium]|nr:hypothetical protein [Clostridia bacterium]